MQSVWPSGGDFATASEPTTPPAPARFSTTTGWPRSSDIFGATRRVMMSVEVPAPKGTTTRTGRFGKAAALGCAAARRLPPSAATVPPRSNPRARVRRDSSVPVMACLLRGEPPCGHEYPARTIGQ